MNFIYFVCAIFGSKLLIHPSHMVLSSLGKMGNFAAGYIFYWVVVNSWGVILTHSVQKFWTPLLQITPDMVILPFMYFLWTPHFWPHFLTISSNNIWAKHKNKLMRESYFLMFSRPQNIGTFFLYKQHFYMLHQARDLIWNNNILKY